MTNTKQLPEVAPSLPDAKPVGEIRKSLIWEDTLIPCLLDGAKVAEGDLLYTTPQPVKIQGLQHVHDAIMADPSICDVAPTVEPIGWKLVPLEPTQEILRACEFVEPVLVFGNGITLTQANAINNALFYKAMLAAAPTAPPAPAIPRAATESMTDAGAASGVRDPRVLSYCWELMYEAALASITPQDDANKLMAAEYQKWIDFYHAGNGDYTDFLCVTINHPTPPKETP
jgi:hypothetical protein